MNTKNEREQLAAKAEKLKNLAEELKGIAEELSDDDLGDVTGAGNPFADVPRVPTQNIDDDLREDA